jgi:thiosulfate reductase / polysulfide reductase chain A
MTETCRTYCGLCHPGCGAGLRVEDDRAIQIEGDPAHPSFQGRLCARGRLMIDHLYHPARLNFPLIRTGERGKRVAEAHLG